MRNVISIVIPSLNRPEQVEASLQALSQQTLPSDQFEVTVVNDGSSVSYDGLRELALPFSFRLEEQENMGAAVARNRGAACSNGDLLLFIDDDIRLRPTTLARLVDECNARERTIVLGALVTPASLVTSHFAQVSQVHSDHEVITEGDVMQPVHFTHTMTGIMTIQRSVFEELGGFQDPAGGRLYWDDVDFGYRAHLAGVSLVRCHAAVAEHWDYSLADWRIAARRAARASELAPRLFNHHPELREQIPMFEDKGPIVWCQDRPRLVLKKLLRIVFAWRPVQRVLESLTVAAETYFPRPAILRHLYRWVIGGYIFEGYQIGLQKCSD